MPVARMHTWTCRYLFPLADVLEAAEEASAADGHLSAGPGDPAEPALWWTRYDGGAVSLSSNAFLRRGRPSSEVVCWSRTSGEDPWLTGRERPTPLRLYRPSDLPDGANLLDSLRRLARDGHTHFVIESGRDEHGTPWFQCAVHTVPAPPAPAAPLWWTARDHVRTAGLECVNVRDGGGQWMEIRLADRSRIGISATLTDRTEVRLRHPQAEFASWQAYWYSGELNDPDSECVEIYDSAGRGLGYTDDTAALAEAVIAYADQRQPPTGPAYPLPEDRALSTAAGTAVEDAARAMERLVRVILVVLAAAVRDVLTDYDHDAPFDAAGLELREVADGSLFPTGRYWDAAGREWMLTTPGRYTTGDVVHDMSEWTTHLGEHNYDLWHPLCTDLPDVDGHNAYRLDLPRAAALPITAEAAPSASSTQS